MTPADNSSAAKFTKWLLIRTVRYWPAQSRDWGSAVIAELDHITDSRDAFRWACGGIFVFLRAVGSHLFYWVLLPPGSKLIHGSSGFDSSDKPRYPKHSRLVTALLLAAAFLLLLLPWGREAISDVRTTTMFFIRSNSERNDAEKLARQGEQENDANKLAFAAINHPDPSRELQLASIAVSLDPSLTWIYADSFHRMNDERDALPENFYQQMIAKDPDNGYLYLLRAVEIGNAKYSVSWNRYPRLSRREIENSFTSDPQWLSLMQKGIAAPRYDSYARNRGKLGRELWNRDNSIPPYLILSSLWHVPIPDFDQLNIYLNFRIRGAKALMASGQIQQAGRSLQELNTFGRRMAFSNQTAFETAMGADISLKALTELDSSYVTPQPAEEATAATELGELESQREAMLAIAKKHFENPAFDPYRRKALHVLLCIVALLIFGLALAIGLGTLEWGSAFSGKRKKWARSLACFATDYAPLALLFACGGLIFSFRPFAAAFAHYRSGNGTLTDVQSFSDVFFALKSVFAPRLPDHATFYAWGILTILLASVAMTIIIRRLYLSLRTA
jgi:hypothetical protein